MPKVIQLEVVDEHHTFPHSLSATWTGLSGRWPRAAGRMGRTWQVRGRAGRSRRQGMEALVLGYQEGGRKVPGKQ